MRVAVDDLTVSRGGTTVLSEVSLDAAPGTLLGVVGPNGAGKTTLVQTVNGTLSPDAGAVRVGGEDVHALSSRAASRRVATLPQEPSLDFAFTAREVVEMGRFPHAPRLGADPDPDAVERALDRTAAAPLADRPITELSGGERQRVLVARAVAQESPVVLLDEPTASLDVNHAVRTLSIARDLAGAGRTVVAAIHDLDLAARYCDELLLLADGAAVAAGDPASVLTAETIERAFGVRAAVTADPVTGSPLVTALPDRPDPEGSVHVIGAGDAAASLLYPLRAAGFEVSVGPTHPDDAAATVARALGGDVLTAPRFQALDPDALSAVRDRVDAADATVVAGLDAHEGTVPLLDAAREADALVVVSDGPLTDRSAVGGAGREALRDLRDAGRVTAPDDVVDAVAAAVAAEPPARAVGPDA